MKALVLLLLARSLAMAQAPLPPDYADRLAQLQARYEEDPRDAATLEALAGSYAIAGNYAEAIRLTREWIALGGTDPAPHLRLAKLYTWTGDFANAHKELRILGETGGTEATALQCSLLSWERRAEDAAACYRRLLRSAALSPEERASAQLQLARNLAWSGRQGESAREYRRYRKLGRPAVSADLEFARLLRYAGNYGEAERVVSGVLAADPNNAEALALQSEILHWEGGRAHRAVELARRASSLRPDLPDAGVVEVYALNDLGDRSAATSRFRKLRQQVTASGFDPSATYAGGYTFLAENVPEWSKPSFKPSFSAYNDSDGIHNSTAAFRSSVLLGNHSVLFQAYRFRSTAPASSIFSAEGGARTADEFLTGNEFHVGPGMNLGLFGGGATVERRGTEPVFSASLRGSPVDRWSFLFEASRDLLPVTPRALDNVIAYIRLRAGVDYRFSSRTWMGLIADRRWWNDGNHSISGEFAFHQALRYSKPFSLEAGPRLRVQTYARDMKYSSGFFTPDLNDGYEGFLHAHGEFGRRMVYEVGGALGAQRVARSADFRRSAEVTASVFLRVARPLSISGNYEWRNYNLFFGKGWYQGVYVEVGVKP